MKNSVMRATGFFLILCLCLSIVAFTFTGCNDNTEPDNPNNSVDPNNPPTSIEVNDNLRVQLLGNTLVRIEQKGPKGFEDRPSYTVQKRLGYPDVSYTVAQQDDFQVITTADCKIYIPERATTPIGCYITDLDGVTLWAGETYTSANVYLPSPSDELNSWYFCDAPRVIPSENGYTPLSDDTPNNGWDLSNDAMDLFVFLSGGSYKQFTSDFVKLTGSSELISLKLLGFWDSRFYAYSTETALQQIDDYLSRGYSIDVLVIDSDWRKTKDGIGYTINDKLFPDMEEFLKKAHEKGVNIVFNDHPEPAEGTTSLLDKDEVEYRNKNLKLLLSLGLDYWWYDRNWGASLGPIKDGISIFASGMYAFQWITEDYYNSITDINEYARRGLIMANVDGIENGTLRYAPNLTAHRYTLQWTGDIDNKAENLQAEIFNAIYGGAELGIPYMSADIGGHWNRTTDDMYCRWIQYGALSPICRVHCTKPFSRMPWLFGETAEKVTHCYVDMRYRLLPLYYALSHENYETGLPLLRRLDILYPQYAEASRNDEYLLGETLLVAPISQARTSTEAFTFSNGTEKGLKGEYFTNTSFRGTPALVRQDETIYFDWGTGPIDGIEKADNVSIRWTGTVTVGKEDIQLQFMADDGLRVWIDDELIADGWKTYDTQYTSNLLSANSSHSIKIEYFEGGGDAHFYLTAVSAKGVSREVFLPDGEWMDVWTGEQYVGPTTITVTHDLTTSPIFLRMGSVLPLADNMKNTDEKDWSHLTLDILPSADKSVSTTLYEDDTQTVAYKDGQYRTTALSLQPDEKQTGKISLTIGAAKGSFNGDRAFTERNWTLRIHGRSDWGNLEKLKVNGNEVSFTAIQKDENANPLSVIGGARDNVIYEYSFKADISAETTVEMLFASAKTSPANPEYNAAKTDFSVEVAQLSKEEANINLTELGTKDWAAFGATDDAFGFRKKGAVQLIGTPQSFDTASKTINGFTMSWSDAEQQETDSKKFALASKHNFELTLKAEPGTTKYQLFIGGYQSLAKLTVRDRSGQVKTYTFGDMNTRFYRMITIDCDAETAGELQITYSLLCGDNITLSAVTAG